MATEVSIQESKSRSGMNGNDGAPDTLVKPAVKHKPSSASVRPLDERATRQETMVLHPLERDSYASTAMQEIVDKSVRATIARMTAGI